MCFGVGLTTKFYWQSKFPLKKIVFCFGVTQTLSTLFFHCNQIEVKWNTDNIQSNKCTGWFWLLSLLWLLMPLLLAYLFLSRIVWSLIWCSRKSEFGVTYNSIHWIRLFFPTINTPCNRSVCGYAYVCVRASSWSWCARRMHEAPSGPDWTERMWHMLHLHVCRRDSYNLQTYNSFLSFPVHH